MKKRDPAHEGNDNAASDLKRRLQRLRRRLEAEGRTRSVRLIDRAIEEAGKATGAAK